MSKRKLFFICFAVALSILVILASNNIFKEDPGYFIVPHGDHNHYVPHNYDRSINIHQFPQRPPREGEIITPDGRIVREGASDFQFYQRNGNTPETEAVQPEEGFSPAQ
jgi:hypothetical protein